MVGAFDKCENNSKRKDLILHRSRLFPCLCFGLLALGQTLCKGSWGRVGHERNRTSIPQTTFATNKIESTKHKTSYDWNSQLLVGSLVPISKRDPGRPVGSPSTLVGKQCGFWPQPSPWRVALLWQHPPPVQGEQERRVEVLLGEEQAHAEHAAWQLWLEISPQRQSQEVCSWCARAAPLPAPAVCQNVWLLIRPSHSLPPQHPAGNPTFWYCCCLHTSVPWSNLVLLSASQERSVEQLPRLALVSSSILASFQSPLMPKTEFQRADPLWNFLPAKWRPGPIPVADLSVVGRHLQSPSGQNREEATLWEYVSMGSVPQRLCWK